ncbi:MAG: rane protein [Pseudomonas sp.]|nr:rane protein [Pseudomonas sp.]
MTSVTPETPASDPAAAPAKPLSNHHLRFHAAHAHLATTFGNDTFALKAEAFARFFGTPTFLGAQTLIVLLWVGANIAGLTHFDVYPFILLNLAFSLQSAYAAPLILLAQTRQAARDKANADADAQHREALAVANQERLASAAQASKMMLDLLEQNTRLTELTKALAERVETLTSEMHDHFVKKPAVQ